MEAAHIPWRPLGELFVARGLITEAELEQALAEQAATKQRLGEILVGRNLISSPELTEALMEQLGREVAKEQGFGSGLWSEIQRRQARPGAEPELSLVAENQDLPSREFGDAVEEPVLHDSIADDLEQDLEELKSELWIVPPPSSPSAGEPGDSMNAELERVTHELGERSTTIETLTSELERTRRSLEAREKTFAEEIDNWQHARREADGLRENLSRREARLVELEAEVSSLMLSREQDNAGESARAEQAEHDLLEARQELEARAARGTELETTLGERDGRIDELQSILAEIRAERDASNERLAEAESRAAEAERALLDVQASTAELEQRLVVAEGRVVELESALREERDAQVAARQRSEEVTAEAAGVREALRAAERELEVARTERDTGLAELDHVRATVIELEGQASEELEQARNGLDQTRARVLDLEQQLTVAADRADDFDGQASALREQLLALETTLATERNALQEAEGRRKQACRKRDTARAELEQTQAELAKLGSALRKEQEAHASARQQSEQARAKLEAAKAKRQTAEDREAELAKQTKRLANENIELSAAASRAREAADLLRAEIQSDLAQEAASLAETRHVLAQALDELTGIRAETDSRGEEAPPHSHEGYLCFAPGKEGYRLLASTGPPPAAGEPYDLDGVKHVVTRVGRSPLPFDRRRCVYLQSVS